MTEKIEPGDRVRHKNSSINGGLVMTVENVDESGQNAQCSHFVGEEQIHKVDWFPVSDLILIRKTEGGFF